MKIVPALITSNSVSITDNTKKSTLFCRHTTKINDIIQKIASLMNIDILPQELVLNDVVHKRMLVWDPHNKATF